MSGDSARTASLAERLARLDPARRAELAARLGRRRDTPPLTVRPGPRETFPLGLDQERLWLLDQLYPGTTTYTLGFGLRFVGEFDRAAFTSAVEQVVARHELLRSGIEVTGDTPRLRVHPGRGAELTFTTSHGPAAEKEDRRTAFIEAQARRPFDLARDPVLRIAVVDLGRTDNTENTAGTEDTEDAGDFQVVQTMPHSFTDQWSYVRLNQELIEFYRAALEHRAAKAPELPVQFGDYAHWQRECFAGPAGQAHREFWRDYLAGVPDRLVLPYDHSPDSDDHAGRQHNFVLDAGVTAAFTARARTARVTMASATAAVYAALLFEETGERDLLVGVPSVTRSEPAVADLIGFLLTNVPLRVRLPEHPTPHDVLAATHAAGAAVAEHHEVPFGEIVRAAAPDRAAGAYPLLQTMLVHLDLQDSVFYEVPGARVHANAVSEGISSMDMTVAWWQVNGLMFGRIEYRTALFEEATIDRLCRRMVRLVEQFATAPDTPLRARDRRPDLTAAWRSHAPAATSDDTPFQDAPVAAARLAHRLRADGFDVRAGDLGPRTTLPALTRALLSRLPAAEPAEPGTPLPGSVGVTGAYLEGLFAQGRDLRQDTA